MSKTRSIKLHNKIIDYTLRTSKRAKRIRLTVYCNGTFAVTKPARLGVNLVEKYIAQKANWILAKLEFFKQFKINDISRNNHASYLNNKAQALQFARERVNHFNKIYELKCNKISVRNQKTRWGSCSKKKNLNFNYKILLLPKDIADYIIVHELCHLKEFNHSQKFWDLVSKAIPNYSEIRRELKNKGLIFY